MAWKLQPNTPNAIIFTIWHSKINTRKRYRKCQTKFCLVIISRICTSQKISQSFVEDYATTLWFWGKIEIQEALVHLSFCFFFFFFFLPLPSDMAWHCDGSLVTMFSDPIRVWQNIEKEHISSDKMVLARLGFES